MEREQLFVGIDPGKSGGIAELWLSPRGGPEIVCHKMPTTHRDMWELFSTWGTLPALVALEKASGRPQQRGAMWFAEHNGALRALVVAAGLPVELVTPPKWQKTLSCLSGGDKSVLKARAQELFPHVKVTAWNQDALLLAEYARRVTR